MRRIRTGFYVFRWYRRLREIEDATREPGADSPALLAELDRLEASAERVNVPLSYTDELYALRQNIAMVRARIRVAASHRETPAG